MNELLHLLGLLLFLVFLVFFFLSYGAANSYLGPRGSTGELGDDAGTRPASTTSQTLI